MLKKKTKYKVKKKSRKTSKRKKKVIKKKGKKVLKKKNRISKKKKDKIKNPTELIIKTRPEWVKASLANKSSYQKKYSDTRRSDGKDTEDQPLRRKILLNFQITIPFV